MKMNEKIEIMLGRRRMKKTDFAESIGVTYRAFANYMNGSRTPRAATLDKMAKELGLTAEFLTNDNEELELTIEERFIKRVCASGVTSEAAQFLSQSRGLFAGNDLSDEDKEYLLKALIDIYEDARGNKTGEK